MRVCWAARRVRSVLRCRLLRYSHSLCLGWLVLLMVVTVYEWAWSAQSSGLGLGGVGVGDVSRHWEMDRTLWRRDGLLSNLSSQHNLSRQGQRLPSSHPSDGKVALHFFRLNKTTPIHHAPSNITPSSAPPTPLLDTVGIRLMPKSPILVSEGHSLKVTCVALQLMHRHQDDAPYITFEFPPMPRTLERQIIMMLRPGAAVMKFGHVSRKHEGVYRCVATDSAGKKSYNQVTINVLKKAEFDTKADAGGQDEWFEDQAAGDQDMDEEDVSVRLQLLKKQLSEDSERSVDIEALLRRGELQQSRVAEYCSKYNMSGEALQLPEGNTSANALYRHLLVNDKARTLFCFAPKAGCTNLRILFFFVQGYIPLSQVVESRDGVDQNKLEGAQFQESFFTRNQNQRRYALQHYFKFVMYRNPLERLVSGFRSKVARYPLVGLKENKPHFNWLRKAILLQTQPELYSTFLHNRGKQPINISFTDFIDYWLKQSPELKFDEHFRSISSLCQPCRARYSFYANFKNFDMDSQLLVDKIGAHPQVLRQGYYNKEDTTSALTPQLYSQLSMQQRQGVMMSLARELDFYYHIFPEEFNSHKSILHLNSDLPEGHIPHT